MVSENDRSLGRRNFLKGAGVALGAMAAAGLAAGCTQQGQQPAAAPAPAGGGAPGAAATAVPVAGPAGFGTQLDDIKKRGTIVIASSMKSAPQTYRDKNGQPAGYDLAIAKMIAADLEVKLDYQEVESGPASIAGLVAGKYDTVLTGLANMPVRGLALQFTRGYVPYDQVLLVRADSTVKNWTELNKQGVKITAQIGASGERRARDAFPNATLTPFTIPEMMLEVASGRADAGLTEIHLALPFAASQNTTKVLMDPVTGKPQVLAREWGCIPSRLGEHTFLHFMENWLNYYWERGTIQSLYDKIMGPALRGENYWR